MAIIVSNADVTLKLNIAGFNRLRNEPGVVADLKHRAQAVADAAGEGHLSEVLTGKTRARSQVVTATYDARRREATDRNLTRAIDAAR